MSVWADQAGGMWSDDSGYPVRIGDNPNWTLGDVAREAQAYVDRESVDQADIDAARAAAAAGTYQSTVANAVKTQQAVWPSELASSNTGSDLLGAVQDALNRGDVVAYHAAIDKLNSYEVAMGEPNYQGTVSDLAVLSHASGGAGVLATQLANGKTIDAVLRLQASNDGGSSGAVNVPAVTIGPDGRGTAVTVPANTEPGPPKPPTNPLDPVQQIQYAIAQAKYAAAQIATAAGTTDPTRTVNDGTAPREISSRIGTTVPSGSSSPAGKTNNGTMVSNPVGTAIYVPPQPGNTQAKATAADNTAQKIQIAAGQAGIQLGPDSWGYYYQQATGQTAPAPESLGYGRAADGSMAPVTFQDWWNKLQVWQGTQTPASSNQQAGGTSAKAGSLIPLVLIGVAAVYLMRKAA